MSRSRLRPQRLARWRRVGVAAALTTAVVLVAIAPGAPANTSAKRAPTITMSGSTSVAPLAALLAKTYVKSLRRCVSFRLAQGGSDVGVADVAAGRVTIGNSSRDPKPTRSGRTGLQQDRQGRALHRHATETTRWPISTRPASRRSSAARCATGTTCRAPPADRHDRRVRSHGRIGHPGRLREDLHGLARRSSAAPGRRPPTASSSRPCRATRTRIGYVSLAFTKGTNPVSYKGVACNLRNAKSGQYGGAAQLLDGHPGRRPGRAAAKFIKWITDNRKAAKRSSPRSGCPCKLR